MKFETRIKCRKYWIDFKRTIHNALFKRGFHEDLYSEILTKFANGEESVRYYMNSYYQPQKSIKHLLEEYHKGYDNEFDIKYLEQIYEYVEVYIHYKVKIYDGIEFVYGECEDGLYFELNLKN